MNMNPFLIPKILYNLQNQEDSGISYDTDFESFVLKILYIPGGSRMLDLANDMLKETRRIEKNMVQKLNCMYFVANRVSMPNVSIMMDKEKQSDSSIYTKCSQQLNDIINQYFSVENEGNRS